MATSSRPCTTWLCPCLSGQHAAWLCETWCPCFLQEAVVAYTESAAHEDARGAGLQPDDDDETLFCGGGTKLPDEGRYLDDETSHGMLRSVFAEVLSGVDHLRGALQNAARDCVVKLDDMRAARVREKADPANAPSSSPTGSFQVRASHCSSSVARAAPHSVRAQTRSRLERQRQTGQKYRAISLGTGGLTSTACCRPGIDGPSSPAPPSSPSSPSSASKSGSCAGRRVQHSPHFGGSVRSREEEQQWRRLWNLPVPPPSSSRLLPTPTPLPPPMIRGSASPLRQPQIPGSRSMDTIDRIMNSAQP